MVLLHEAAHIRRDDQFTQLFAVAVAAIYWFNPLVWHALKCLRRENEKACDDSVLNAGELSSSYGRHIVEIAMNTERRGANAVDLWLKPQASPGAPPGLGVDEKLNEARSISAKGYARLA